MSKINFDPLFADFKKSIPEFEDTKKVLGSGGFGEVREVKYKGRVYAGKLAEKKNGSFNPEKIRGPNIIKIIKILEKKIPERKSDGKIYNLFIMEKALLKDLGTMINHLHSTRNNSNNVNFFKLINSPFLEVIGNNFLKFFVKQILQGLEILERNELVHFDIKPENLLIQSNLILKITDFSFLMNLQEYEDGVKSLKIPGGTPGYVTPESFHSENIDRITAKKQDYFALGATIYFLKVGHQMLKYYNKNENDKMTEDRIIDLLQRDIAHINAQPLMDKEFVKFLCKLIQYVPEERPSFEEIYRNKWLNENLEDIYFTTNMFAEGDESTLMKELAKSDFIIAKEKEIHNNEKQRAKFTFEE